MKIILDDQRPFKQEFKDNKFNCIRSYDACIALLGKDTTFISLDYELNKTSNESGMDILIYMKSKDIYPETINIHSSHPTGKYAMIKYIRDNFPNTKITTNSID